MERTTMKLGANQVGGALIPLDTWATNVGISLLSATQLAKRQKVRIFNMGGALFVTESEIATALTNETRDQTSRQDKRKTKDFQRRYRQSLARIFAETILARLPLGNELNLSDSEITETILAIEDLLRDAKEQKRKAKLLSEAKRSGVLDQGDLADGGEIRAKLEKAGELVAQLVWERLRDCEKASEPSLTVVGK